jgi:hypothetical protein
MALHEAAASGDVDALYSLLLGGANVDECDEVRLRERRAKGPFPALTCLRAQDGCTALHMAVQQESPAPVEALLRAGASPDARDRKRGTPLLRYVESAPQPPTVADTAIASLLMAHGADVNATDEARRLCARVAAVVC